MTEEEWLVCEDPQAMLRSFNGMSARKLQLFGCACCRRIWHLLKDDRSQQAVTSAELYADNDNYILEAYTARTEAESVPHPRDTFDWENRPEGDDEIAIYHAAAAACCAISMPLHDVRDAAHEATLSLAYEARFAHREKRYAMNRNGSDPVLRQAVESEERLQAALLRDIFGNPFRPVAFDPAWRTDTAVSLAQGVYESRDFNTMPILADALQDAGCDSDDVLNHCRDADARSRVLGGRSGAGQRVRRS